MLEHSLLKSHFIGRDGFRWWIGQIAPDDVNADQTKFKKGWGIRYKVRIMGYHPYNISELPDADLPWAQVLLPPGYGTGSGSLYKTVRYQQGDTVVGFFLDGDNGQIPVIFGAFGNSKYRAEEGAALPFKPYTGFTGSLEEPKKNVAKTTNHNDASNPPEQPRNTSPKRAKQVGAIDNNEAFYNQSTGKVLHLATGESTTSDAINKMKTGVEGFVQDLDNMKAEFDSGIEFGRDKVKGLIDDKVQSLTGVASGMVGGMANNMYTKMVPQLNMGLGKLYDSVYYPILAATQSPSLANKAGTLAQASQLAPVGAIESLLPCIVNKVAGNLGDSLTGILGAVADNVLNYVDCVGDQAVGAVVNNVIDQLADGMSDVLGGVSKITQFIDGFSAQNLLRNGIDSLLGMAGLGDCNVTPGAFTGVEKYRVGFGPVVQDEPDLSKIIKDANVAKSISDAAKLAGFPLDSAQDLLGGFDLLSGAISKGGSALSSLSDGSAISPCNAALPEVCGPPSINIFGGGGKEAKALPFFGKIVGEGRKMTGSIIGIKVTNPGNGYLFPPFVEIVDNCKQGYGAHARAEIKDGKIESIVIVSEGELYPISDRTPPIISTVTIVNPGSGYASGDYVIDQFDNEYAIEILSGSIIKITPINSKDITELPVLKVITKTGSGAILKANLDIRPEFQGEVKQVIDCVNT